MAEAAVDGATEWHQELREQFLLLRNHLLHTKNTGGKSLALIKGSSAID